MNKSFLFLMAGSLVMSSAMAQNSQRTNIKGNTEINATTKNMTAVAAGDNNVA